MTKKPDETPVTVSITLPKHLWDRIDGYCKVTKAKRSGAVHIATEYYFTSINSPFAENIIRLASTAKK